MSLISLEQVDKRYPLRSHVVHAVRGVDLRIERGEFVALSGPSGSGKSTLFSLIAAMTPPSAGKVSVDGTDVGRLDSSEAALLRRRLFGFVFQSFNLMPVLNAFENIELPLLLGSATRRERAARVHALAERLDIGEMLTHRPEELSGGQKQRVAIARALVGRPRIVIADEPTANLDSTTGQLVLELAKERCRDDQVTFLFSSHDPAMVGQAQRVIVMRDGAIDGAGVKEQPARPDPQPQPKPRVVESSAPQFTCALPGGEVAQL